MEINVTSKNVSYDSNTAIAHYGAHFNSQAQVLSFNIDVMNPAVYEDALAEFETFKSEVMELIEPDIIYPEPAPEVEPEEGGEEGGGDIDPNPVEEENNEGGNE